MDEPITSIFPKGLARMPSFSTLGTLKGIALLAVVAVVIILIFILARRLGAFGDIGDAFRDFLGGGQSSDALKKEEALKSEQRIKDNEVELKQQLQAQADKNREIALDDNLKKSEAIKRTVEREIAQAEETIKDTISKALRLTERQLAFIHASARFDRADEERDEIIELIRRMNAGQYLSDAEFAKVQKATNGAVAPININDVFATQHQKVVAGV